MKKGFGKQVYMNLALISQFALSMMVPTFLMLGIGLLIEKKTGWFVAIPALVLGMLAGFRNMYILGMKANRKSEHQDRMKEEQKILDEAAKKWDADKRDKN